MSPDILRIAVAQLKPTVGDLTGNIAKARAARAEARIQGADLVLFTELFVSGYLPEDLVLKDDPKRDRNKRPRNKRHGRPR